MNDKKSIQKEQRMKAVCNRKNLLIAKLNISLQDSKRELYHKDLTRVTNKFFLW